MPKRLALITTGGTIGSAFAGDHVRTDAASAADLRGLLEQVYHKHDADYEIIPALNLASDNFAPRDWITVLRAVEECLERHIERIVITHGTDTMAETATALSLLFGESGARIVMTGAMRPPNDPRGSDARDNIDTSISAVLNTEMAPGVYVAMCSLRDFRRLLLPAACLMPAGFDETEFHLARGLGRAWELGDTWPAAPDDPIPYDPARLHLGLPLPTAIGAAARDGEHRIERLVAHPGLDAVMAAGRMRAGDIAIVQLYHSGTAPANGEPGGLLELLRDRQDIYVLGATLPANQAAAPYESTRRLAAAGMRFYVNLQPHQLHVFFELGLAQGRTMAELLGILAPWQWRG